ncbi:MAG: secondary thiamine-phosphate synthase enzyme YjbQ [Ignavibacteriaceae bacterium]|nr:secondary thiamine-phosphate synthase enzyme YjbQ [Ignavibacteriaceae bacterium]
MEVFQKEIKLPPKHRGFNLITGELEKLCPEIKTFSAGIVHIFIQHTSALLTLNENADPSVRADLETHFNKLAPENQPYYLHNSEGSDDMPAHIKASLLSSSVSIPLTNGELNLGTWQGIYLCEHRNYGGARKLVVTIFGEKKK